MTRVFNLMQELHLKNLFNGLKNVCDQMKQLRLNEKEWKARRDYRQRKNAIEKWHLRKQETLRCRQVCKAYNDRHSYLTKKRVFKELHVKFNTDEKLSINLSNLENFMRTKMYMDAFKCIKSFSTTRALNYGGRKKSALAQFKFMVRYQYENTLKWAFERYRDQCKNTVQK